MTVVLLFPKFISSDFISSYHKIFCYVYGRKIFVIFVFFGNQNSSIWQQWKFCSLFCILCVQNKGFKFSFFFLFYAIFLQLLMYFYRFLKATFTDSVPLLRLTMSSLYTSVLGVTTGNCISSSREYNGLLLNVLSISRSIFSFRSSSFRFRFALPTEFSRHCFLNPNLHLN